jgi:hypothetical protein
MRSVLASKRFLRGMMSLSVGVLFSVVVFGYDDKWSRMPVWIGIACQVVFWTSLVGLAFAWRAERR